MFVKDIERRCGYFCNFRFSPEDLRGVLQILHTPYTALRTLVQYFLVSSRIETFGLSWLSREGGSGGRFTHFGSFSSSANHTLLHADQAKKGVQLHIAVRFKIHAWIFK